MTEPKKQQAGGSRWRWTAGFLKTFADLPLGLVLVKVNLGAHLGHTRAYPGPAEARINCGSLCSSKHIAQGQ